MRASHSGLVADIRQSSLYQQAQSLFEEVWRPGSGRPTQASEVAVSPDEQRIAFTGTLLQALDGAPATRICMADMDTGDLRIVSFGPHLDLTPRFSPDGRYLAFRSDRSRSGDFQVHLLDLHSGEVRAAPVITQGWVETLEFSRDGRRLLLLVTGHGSDVAGAQGAKTSQRADAVGAPAWLPSVETSDPQVGRSAWILDVAGHRLDRVSPTGLNLWEVTWCGTDAIAAIASPGASEDEWYRAQVARIGLHGQDVSVLYKPRDQLGSISASPDGRTVAVIEAVCSDRGLCAGNLLIVDPSGAGARAVGTDNVDVTFTAWRDNCHLLIAGIRHLETVVADLDLNTGHVAEHWRSEALSSWSPAYPQAVPTGDRGYVMIAQGHRTPAHVLYGEAGQTRTIVSLAHAGTNSVADKLRPVRAHRWKAPDGQEIEGWLMPGAGTEPTATVMEVHGGPIWRWSPFFLGRSAYHVMLAELGYAFFWPNPRGSSGRGQDFARSVVGDMGGADTQDYLSGLDSLVADGIADPARIAVMGGSYGGFMTAWLVTCDVRFRAAVAVSPVTNWVSHHLTCNIPHFDAFCLDDKYTDREGTYFSRSPIMFAQRAQTPVLNICGALDRCTPPGQAREFHSALRQHGVESALVTYPAEGHGVRTFPAMIDYAARIVDWLTQHNPVREG